MVANLAGLPYDQLYAEHAQAARRLALTLVPPHVADDVVAEAFTRVLDASRRNGLPRQFRPYLMRTVRNTAATYHERGRHLTLVPDPEPEPAEGPEAAVMAREDARLAVAAFRRLPVRWQSVLWATAVEERSVTDLAASWGMAPNTVSQLASRAREGLRQGYLSAHLGTNLSPACREVAPYMGAAVRGHAGRRHVTQLARHLRDCDSCAQAYDGLRGLNTRLGELLVPAAAAGPLLAHALPATRAGVRAGVRQHLPALIVSGLAAVGAAVAVPFVVPGSPGAGVPPSGSAAGPGAAPGASLGPAQGSRILAGGLDAGPVASLPGGVIPGAPQPGGDLPGTPQPGGLLPGGSLPGGIIPPAGASTSAQLPAGTGSQVNAGAQGGQLGADASAGDLTAGVNVPASPGAALSQVASHAAGEVTGLPSSR